MVKRANDCMPLNLHQAQLALQGLSEKPAHVRVFKNYLMAWFFEPTIDPNVEYEIVLRYDGKDLTVARVQIIRIEPLALTDITKHWQRNQPVEDVVNRASHALQLA